MGSKVLPQALLVLPRNHPAQAQCPAKKTLPFSTDFSYRFSVLKISTSRVSSTSYRHSSFNCNPTAPILPAKQSFIVRSEASSSSEGESQLVSEENVQGSTDASSDSEIAQSNSETEEAQLEEKPTRKPRVKLGEIMGILNRRAVEASDKARPIPDIRTGDIVEIKLEVPENRRRLSVYKGIVISKQNAGIHSTIRVRRIIAGVGVEIVFPLYSPNIKEIKVVDHRKVRKSRLYYLRDKLPRLSTFK
ncbi:hypothetical protein Ancab_033306 [Ancistrocladus abbreviatus]